MESRVHLPFEERRLSGLPDPDPGFRHFPEPTSGVCIMLGALSVTVSRTTPPNVRTVFEITRLAGTLRVDETVA